ncbi:hypothetical protein [Leptospira stimsonii]|uniref:Uncharacterized protein n=1 Tax=Leptospira stimsonii TaxID=2202203 RepID=A0ABY2N9F7_9LEPT|nr:hypothetical protein [Leptospira stimsonii]TGK12854.1 hypothetical protein EHO98_19650 [Leptospira stimsonii]TGM18792.1 hypothetical protein EHQ90_06390 [Leptospira stimsonii]
MRFGLVTIKEADDFLQYYSGGNAWRDAKRSWYYASGTVTAVGDKLVGFDLDFTAAPSLAAGEILDIDSQLVKVVSIEGALNATIEPIEQDVITPIRFRRIPTADVDSLRALYERKREALVTADLRLLNSSAFNYDLVSPESLRKAQIVFALELFKTPINKHSENRSNGIQSYSISDMSYTYKSGATRDIPEAVFDFVKREGAPGAGTFGQGRFA